MAATTKPAAIMVQGVTSNISGDTLENFFENRRRSGGGAIADIIFDQQEQAALIQFEDEEVLKRVLKQSAPEICETKLQIRKAQTYELELLRVLWVVNLPPGATEESLTLFFESRKRCSGGDVEQVELRPDRRQARVIFMESSDAQRVFNHGQLVLNKDTLQVRRCLGNPEMSTDTRTSKGDQQSQGCTEVLEGEVKVPGESAKKDSIQLTTFQVKYLNANNLIKEVTCMMPKLSVVINETEGLLELEGLEREVDKAQVKVLKIIQSLLNQKEMLSGTKVKLLSSQEAVNHITSLFEMNRICAVWTSDENSVTVYATLKQILDKAVQIINSKICETKIELEVAAQDLLGTQAWKSFEESLITKYNGLIAIEVSSSRTFMTVAFVKDKCESCVPEINNFFVRNAVITLVVTGPPAAIKALTSVWQSKLQDIAWDHQVSINVSDESSLQIEGRREDVTQAEDNMKTLLTSVITKECELSNYDWLHSSIGGWALQGIQHNLNAFITESGAIETHVLVICGWCESDVGSAMNIVQKCADAATKEDTSLREKEKTIKELQKEISSLQTQNSLKDYSLEDNEKIIEQLHKETTALKKQNLCQDTSLREMEMTKDLQREISALENQNSSKEKEIAIKEFQNEISTLKNQNSSKDESFKDSQRTIEKLQQEITTLKSCIPPQGPVCGHFYGIITGNQPTNGKMSVKEDLYIHLPGYDRYGAYEIEYTFPDGIQSKEHPNPGKPYLGTYHLAYLPVNKEGKELVKLLEKAFQRRLTFTVGHSDTIGREKVVVWNGIHHKTSIDGGPQNNGYPDPDYMQCLRAELAAKGIR